MYHPNQNFRQSQQHRLQARPTQRFQNQVQENPGQPVRVHNDFVKDKNFMIMKWPRYNKSDDIYNYKLWDKSKTKLVRDAKGVKADSDAPGLKNRKLKEGEKPEDPEFGMGSEYKKKQKDAAKMLKRGFTNGGKRKVNVLDLPWNLDVRLDKTAVKNKNSKNLSKVKNSKTEKSFIGTRNQINEASMLFLLTQSDGVFEAFPVQSWYDFKPKITYRTITIEEAEDKWDKRDKIHNTGALMSKLIKLDGDQKKLDPEVEKLPKTKKSRKNDNIGNL